MIKEIGKFANVQIIMKYRPKLVMYFDPASVEIDGKKFQFKISEDGLQVRTKGIQGDVVIDISEVLLAGISFLQEVKER